MTDNITTPGKFGMFKQATARKYKTKTRRFLERNRSFEWTDTQMLEPSALRLSKITFLAMIPCRTKYGNGF